MVSAPAVNAPEKTRLQLVRDRVGTTPGLLKLALGANVALTLLFFLVVLAAVRSHREGMKTVADDSLPSVVYAQEIKANLADMHSDAANWLLAEPGGKAETDAANAFEKRRKDLTEPIIAAAKNITYEDSKDPSKDERAQIRLLLNHLGRYEQLVAEAALLHRQQKDQDALRRYRTADGVVHQDLFPAADQLTKINDDHLEQAYRAERMYSWGTLVWVLLAGLLLLATLGAAQAFLFRRMHRIVNPGLAAATALALVFLIYAAATLLTEAHDLKVVKQDCFDSIYALEQARAVAYDANGDESRWLLEGQQKGQAEASEKAFHDRAAKLFTLPAGASPDRVVSDLRAGKPLLAGAKGYLADELNNITFVGERDAAVRETECWLEYVRIDGQIRDLERAGQHEKAVALCLGEKPGESNWAFDQFSESLGKTLQINKDALAGAETSGYAALGWLKWLNPVAAAGIILLTFLGLRPRLREYAF